MFDDYLTLWNLTPDGAPITTHSARLLPVRRNSDNVPAMLKIARDAEEKFGGGLMVWWDGDGAAPVLAHDDNALLLLRAEGTQSLTDMARNGLTSDDEATRILCRTVARLHAPRDRPAPTVIPLTEWFRELFPIAQTHGGIPRLCAQTADKLLSAPQSDVVLHGDIHHANVLDFGPRGWLAIDPKRLGGERGFDYANLFCNPDGETATRPGRFARRLSIVAEESGLERTRLLAWSGLSAAWTLREGHIAETALMVAEIAAAELNR